MLHVEAGRTKLSLEEWQQSKPGDVILFDTTFFDPTQKETQCLLTVNGEPLFLAKVEKQQITILKTQLPHAVDDA
jgi:hypothetical protein